MDERIKEHLKLLNKYYLLLAEMRESGNEAFAKDSIHRGAAERFLHLSVESCLNIGNRLISLYQFKKPIDTPETYADIFIQLRNLGAIEGSFCDRLVKLAKLRNGLVHLYWEINRDKIYEIIRHNLEDFKLFEQKVVKFLKDSEKDWDK